MVCTVAAGTQANYYLNEQAEYYTGGTEPAGVWCLQEELFGLQNTEQIRASDFRFLHEGLDLDGEPLGQKRGTLQKRVTGYDLTFSAPKSVSVLWAVCSDEQRSAIEAAQEKAVRAALSLVNDHAAFARRGKGGAELERVSLNAALFQHGESRAEKHADGTMRSDPQLHTHAVVLNIAQRSDGSWGAIDGRQLFHWKMAAGAYYRAALAKELVAQLGVEITEVDDKGLFEVAGIPKDVRDAFSSRRASIVDALSQNGMTSAESPELAAHIAKTKRQAKSTDLTPSGDRHDRWRREAQVLGFAISDVDACVIRKTSKPQDLTAFVKALPTQLTEHNSVFTKQDVILKLAIEAVKLGCGDKEIAVAVDELLAEEGLVELGRNERGQAIYSTKEQIVLEQDLQRLAKTGSHSDRFSLERLKVISALSNSGLSVEQKDAVISVTTGKDVTIIEGAAGSGKSHSLKFVADLYRKEGKRVIGSATAWKIAKQLAEDCRIETKATDAWLTGTAHGKSFLDANTVLIVDEAGQLSAKQMHSILSHAKDVKAKVILTGDQKQLQAIGAGPGLRIVAGQTGSVRIETARRQQDKWARDAATDFSLGRADKALAAFENHGKVHWASSEEAVINIVVDKWIKNRQARPKEAALILAKTNAKVAKLNEKIRDELKQSGEIRGEEIQVLARTSSGKVARLPLAAGDQARFTKRNDDLGVINGTTAKVLKIETNRQDEIKLTLQMGDKVKSVSLSDLADDKGRVPLTHNYASTIYSAQGMTVDRAYVLADSSLKRNEIYVAASRAKFSTELVIDESEAEQKVRQKELLSEKKTKVIGKAELLDEVAAGWQVSQDKVSVFDYTGEGVKAFGTVKSKSIASQTSDKLQRVKQIIEPRTTLEL